MSTAGEAAAEWEALAAAADDRAAYLGTRGEYAGVQVERAKLYRAVALALRSEERTGLPHCTCHNAPVKRDGAFPKRCPNERAA